MENEPVNSAAITDGSDMEKIEAVVVSCVSSRKKSFGIATTSGLLFAGNLVIVPGTIIYSVLDDQTRNQWERSILPILQTDLSTNATMQCKFYVYKEGEDVTHGDIANVEKRLIATNGRPVAVWKCPLVSMTLKNLFNDWTLRHISISDGSHVNSSIAKEILSVLMLLKCESPQNRTVDILASVMDLRRSLREPVRGAEIAVVSTPFGNRMFANSVSCGVVSNVVGLEKCLILVDARTVPGCEGGPIFSRQKPSHGSEKDENHLLGLVICPLTWWRGEWVGLTIGINLMPVLKKLLQNYSKIGFTESTIVQVAKEGEYVTDFTELVDECVVLVKCENAWGSGVVFDPRTVITCSHILKGSNTVSVFWRKRWYSAFVVYRTSDDKAYDLAVIELENDTFRKKMEFSQKPCAVGDKVVAVGYPFFSKNDECELRPTVVHGCIAKVHFCMLQTTCCIQSGFSGGALLKNGKLLGLIFCNVKDSAESVLFPHINFAIPSWVFQETLSIYLKTRNVKCLESLECTTNEVQLLWSLGSSKL